MVAGTNFIFESQVDGADLTFDPSLDHLLINSVAPPDVILIDNGTDLEVVLAAGPNEGMSVTLLGLTLDEIVYEGSTFNFSGGLGGFLYVDKDPGDTSTIFGTGSADQIIAQSGNDTINGLDGDDLILLRRGPSGGYDNDIINGGYSTDGMLSGQTDTGIDTLGFFNPDRRVNVNLLNGTVAGGAASSGAVILFNSIDNVIGTAFNDTITGDAGANELYGGGGGDKLSGASGNDTLAGGAGIDTLNGGGGADYANYTVATAGINVNLGANTAGNDGNGASDSLLSIERVIGSPFNDTITGGTGVNRLEGGVGNDILNGGGGGDVLLGGGGNDVLIWDPADANVDGGGGNGDILNIAGAGVTLDLTLVSNTLIKGIEKINLNGSGNSTLVLAMNDLMDLSGSTDQLIVMGNAGDGVYSSAQGWALFGQQMIGAQNYDEYHHLGHVLLVDRDMAATSIIS